MSVWIRVQRPQPFVRAEAVIFAATFGDQEIRVDCLFSAVQLFEGEGAQERDLRSGRATGHAHAAKVLSLLQFIKIGNRPGPRAVRQMNLSLREKRERAADLIFETRARLLDPV